MAKALFALNAFSFETLRFSLMFSFFKLQKIPKNVSQSGNFSSVDTAKGPVGVCKI